MTNLRRVGLTSLACTCKHLLLSQAGRLQVLNLSLDPRERHTVWGTLLGGGVNWMGAFAVSQMQVTLDCRDRCAGVAQVQRYLSIPKVEDAKKACYLTMTLIAFLVVMVGWLGLVLYAVYAHCDPVTAQQVIPALGSCFLYSCSSSRYAPRTSSCLCWCST